MSDKDAQSISRGERSNLLARNAANGVVEGVASILDEERGETDVSERSRARTSTSRGCLASVALMACAVGAGMAVASRGGVDDARTSDTSSRRWEIDARDQWSDGSADVYHSRYVARRRDGEI
jgi:hypothetical protein